MVQSISSEKANIITQATQNSSAKLVSSDDFLASLNDAQSKISGTESAATAGSSDSKKSESTEDLIKQLKDAYTGITVCSKCGAMYRGTSVSTCAKCGNDMSKDNDSTSKLQGADSSAATGATSAVDASKSALSANSLPGLAK